MTNQTPPARPRCGSPYPADPEVTCIRPPGHEGDHRQAYHHMAGASWPNAAVPQRCGRRYIVPMYGGGGVEHICALPDGHRLEFHRTESGATWSSAYDFQPAPSLQHDACGARLTLRYPTAVTSTDVCALGPHDFNTWHRAADGTQWRATDFPPTATAGEDGALSLGPIVARIRGHREMGDHMIADEMEPLVREVMRLRRRAAERSPGHQATVRSALDGISRQLSGMRDVFGELLSATCTGCRPVALSSNPEDGADLEAVPGCPVHSEVAELRRSLDWAVGQYGRIALALGPEYVGPFAPDIAAEAEACIKTARGLDGTLRADAGIEHPLGLRGVDALISQRDAAREHAKNAESDLAVIGQAARLVLADLSGDATALTSALTNIVAIIERRAR